MIPISNGNPEKCAQVKEQYLLFDLFKAFNQIESSHKSDFSPKYLFSACATCSVLSSNTMSHVHCTMYNNANKTVNLLCDMLN